MRRNFILTESDIYRIVKKVIRENQLDNFGNEIESFIDLLIDEYGVPGFVSFDELSGLELQHILSNYEEMIYSLRELKNLVMLSKKNFGGIKKSSFFGKMFGGGREKMEDRKVVNDSTRQINRRVIQFGRQFLHTDEIIPADERMDKYDTMINVLDDKISYIKQLTIDLISELKERKKTNFLDKKGRN